jgi:hypothetical protein
MEVEKQKNRKAEGQKEGRKEKLNKGSTRKNDTQVHKKGNNGMYKKKE